MTAKRARKSKPEKKDDILFSVTLADCDVQVSRGHGPGGQHRNRTNTAVRIVHRASGAVGYAQEERSQLMNKEMAFKRMAESKKFQLWARMQASIMDGLDPEAEVEKMMKPHNIRVEGRVDGLWQEIEIPL